MEPYWPVVSLMYVYVYACMILDSSLVAQTKELMDGS